MRVRRPSRSAKPAVRSPYFGWDEYERLMAVDDAWWAEQARKAEKKGYVGPTAAMKVIKSRMREKTGSHS